MRLGKENHVVSYLFGANLIPARMLLRDYGDAAGIGSKSIHYLHNEAVHEKKPY